MGIRRTAPCCMNIRGQHAGSRQRSDADGTQGDGGVANAQSGKRHGDQLDGIVSGDQLRQRHIDSVYDHRLSRFASGSKDPAGIIGGYLIASMASVVAGITAARLLSRSPKCQVASSLADDAPADTNCKRRQRTADDTPSDASYHDVHGSGQPMGDPGLDHAGHL